MRPLTCRAGYPMPIARGRFEVWGFCATVNNTAAVSRLTLVDSEDYAPVANDSTLCAANERRLMTDAKGLANGDGYLSVIFPEPIKTIKGVTVAATTNLEAGKIFVYVR